MHFLTAALLSLSASTLATASSTHAPSSKRHSNLKRGSGYSLTTDARGADFFELFQFEEGSNNNGGMARYVDEATAWKDGLVAVKDGKAHIRVSPEGNGPTRDAVKLVSKQRYSEGLYVWDVERMPRTSTIFRRVESRKLRLLLTNKTFPWRTPSIFSFFPCWMTYFHNRGLRCMVSSPLIGLKRCKN